VRTRPERDRDLGDNLHGRIAALVYGAVLGVLFGIPVSALLGLRGLGFVAFTLVFALVTAFTIQRIVIGVPDAVASFFTRMVFPSGSTTPYAKVYSREQSLAARGDVAAALEAYEEAMRLNPADPEPRFQAAELVFRSSDASRAATLFAEARRLAADDRGRELYATQRLIDLYLGPLQNEGRALVELRRLVDRFPATREGEAARELLARLKSESRDGDQDGAG
jgi:hypothetical protein